MGRRRGIKRDKAEKGPRLTEAEESLLTMAARLIDDHHGHLSEAKISFWMVSGKWSAGGVDVSANVQLVTGANRKETGNVFRIMISENAWNAASEEQKKYLLDSQLTRMCKGETGNGEARWYIRDYALKTFPSLVTEYGMITDELRKFDAAVRQTALEFGKDEESGAEDDKELAAASGMN